MARAVLGQAGADAPVPSFEPSSSTSSPSAPTTLRAKRRPSAGVGGMRPVSIYAGSTTKRDVIARHAARPPEKTPMARNRELCVFDSAPMCVGFRRREAFGGSLQAEPAVSAIDERETKLETTSDTRTRRARSRSERRVSTNVSLNTAKVCDDNITQRA